jgi:hypothetical protein
VMTLSRKNFTGVLVLKMIEEKIINEDELILPIATSGPKFIESLPTEFKDYLVEQQITLFQLMTHQKSKISSIKLRLLRYLNLFVLDALLFFFMFYSSRSRKMHPASV